MYVVGHGCRFVSDRSMPRVGSISQRTKTRVVVWHRWRLLAKRNLESTKSESDRSAGKRLLQRAQRCRFRELFLEVPSFGAPNSRPSLHRAHLGVGGVGSGDSIGSRWTSGIFRGKRLCRCCARSQRRIPCKHPGVLTTMPRVRPRTQHP